MKRLKYACNFVEINKTLSYNLIRAIKLYDNEIYFSLHAIIMERGFIMDNRNNLSDRIEKLRNEISQQIDDDLHNMTIDDLVDKSNELNKLIVEYYKQTTKND